MPRIVSCPGCGTQLVVHGKPTGKAVRCPECTEMIRLTTAQDAQPLIPFAPTPPAERKSPMAELIEEAEEAAEEEVEKPRRRKAPPNYTRVEACLQFLSRHARKIPFFLLPLVVLAILLPLWGRLRGPIRPRVQVVDAYTAIADVPEAKDLIADMVGIPQAWISKVGRDPTRLLVTRPNPKGRHLLVTFRLSQKLLDERFGSRTAMGVLTASDVELQGDGAPEHPLLLWEQLPAKGFTVKFPRPDPDEEEASPPLGPRPDSPWRHAGELAESPDGKARFRGRGGMVVEFATVSDSHPKIAVTWDRQSTGWFGQGQAHNPNNLLGGWDVACVFVRPRASGRLVLRVLGQPFELDPEYARPAGGGR
jgi:hypothetical protein